MIKRQKSLTNTQRVSEISTKRTTEEQEVDVFKYFSVYSPKLNPYTIDLPSEDLLKGKIWDYLKSYKKLP